MTTDADAVPHLLDAMRAAATHDSPAIAAALDAAEQCLPKQGHHQSRQPIAAARHAVTEGDWGRVWAGAYQAICSLTWAFPPDLATCPPPPDGLPAPAQPVCPRCDIGALPASRFCSSCGSLLIEGHAVPGAS